MPQQTVRVKPIVMPVLFGDEEKSVARKIYTAAPSTPAVYAKSTTSCSRQTPSVFFSVRFYVVIRFVSM